MIWLQVMGIGGGPVPIVASGVRVRRDVQRGDVHVDTGRHLDAF